jgi:putative spermidine/putrescine transport system substrate-binding protein
MPLGRLTCHLSAVLIILLALSLPAYAVETLRVLAWPGYADSDLVKTFEKRFDVHVEVSFVGSGDVLREKISANQGGDFDIFAANTAEMQHYIRRMIRGNMPEIREM